MNYSEIGSIELIKSSNSATKNIASNKLFKHFKFTAIFVVLLLAVAFAYVGNSTQYTKQSSLITSEVKCNNYANRTGYAFGCKINND